MNATYRLQLTPEFSFTAVRKLLPYFQKLGVSHLYLSPITEARAGSSHGYDVIDHNEVRAEFGGREGFEALREAALEYELALILDFVPNHAAVGPANALWQDVLAYGPFSPFATTFDIDWHPLKPELEQKILLPFLGRPYGEALDGGEIGVAYAGGRFYAHYGDHRFALCPATYGPLLEALAPTVPATRRAELAALQESYVELARSEREKAEALVPRLEEVLAGLELEALEDFKGEALHELLERQFWRLAYWKTAGYEINYRRFFDVNELVALRMEEGKVFARNHRLLSELLAEEGVSGVRIDHVDGLFDPQGYLEALQAGGAKRVWVEKVLASGEILPESWPVCGTTGYEFLNDALRVLIPPAGVGLRQVYARFIGHTTLYPDVVHDSKLLTMETSLAGELMRLSYELYRLSEADYHTRDFTLEALREALAEIIAAFPRYRTYLPHEREEAEAVIWQAVAEAKRRTPAIDPSTYDFIARYLLTTPSGEAQRKFLGRFQQYTAPVAAKGVEDTAFYRYCPLAALCEVGGDADTFAASPQAFHSRARFRAHRYPENLLTTATHDNKRGEDTRMRLAALGELGEEWQTVLDTLHGEAQRYRSLKASVGAETVHLEDEYFFYQHLLALWGQPDLLERLQRFMQKALREAKLHSSWINPNEAYEQAVAEFVAHILESEAVAEIVTPLAGKLAAFGFQNSLVQLVLKTTTPGVPDFYQGSELLNLSLVDPDNRRPVDFEARRKLLEALSGMLEHPQVEALQAWLKAADARLKLYFTAKLLRFRCEHESLFQGSYVPLEPVGTHADNLLAFAREEGTEQLVVVVGRFFTKLTEGWEDTGLDVPEPFQGAGWQEVLTGCTCNLAKRFSPAELKKLPAAVFFREVSGE